MLDLLSGFVTELRRSGLPVSLTEHLDAAEAVKHIPLEDREALKYALAATLVLNVVLLIELPKGFFPVQDTGEIQGVSEADQDISFPAMQAATARFVSIVKEDPAVANTVAPEHLQLMVADADAPSLLAQVKSAGAVFIGPWAPASLGDYIAGPNHVLPTGRTARFASGLSGYDFLKRTTWIDAGQQALDAIGPAAVMLAEAEGLTAHARSLRLRLGAMRLGQ